MTRHIFALLALLSGLAAISSPAHASVSQALSCNVGITAEVGEDKAGTPAELREATKKQQKRCPAIKTPKALPLPTTLRRPVLMGIERAFE